jgi:Flp pilus assembly protein TadD
MCDRAIAELQRVLDRGQQDPNIRGVLAYAYAIAGKKGEARKVLDELKAIAPGRSSFAYPVACIYAALGDKDQAFAWLRKACDEHAAAIVWIKVDPMMDNLRSDPRFSQVLKVMGLPL